MSWWTMLALAAGVYLQRLVGMFALDTSRLRPRGQRVVASLPLAIIAAVVALQTFSSAGRLGVDERAVGVAVAAIGAWRRLPLAVIVVAAAATTALLRSVQ